MDLSKLSRIVSERLEKDISLIDGILSEKDLVRENAIKISRDIIRLSAESIRLIHLQKYSEAKEKLRDAEEKVKELVKLLSNHEDLFFSGLTYNCLSEFVEAYILYKLIVEKDMPSYEELKLPYIPFLQGLGDVVGELRRYIIDLLKEERYEESKEYLLVIETIYQMLKRLNYPDALTPGLRHKVDVARRLVEDTKVLYVSTVTAAKLRESIEKLLNKKSS